MSTLPHPDFAANFGSLAQAGETPDHIREVFLHAPVAIALLTGPEHRFAFVNHRCVRLFGRNSAAEVLGKPVREALPELAGQPYFDLMDNVYRTGEHFIGNELLIPFDREGSGQTSEAYFNFIYQPTRDAHGKIEGMLATAIEVTEQVVAREAIRASEERYRVLYGALPVAAFVCDRDAVIQNYNSRAVELWGREPRVGVERHCGSMKLWLPNGTQLPHAQSPMIEVLRTGISARNIEVSIERPDGSRIPVIVNFCPLRDSCGEIAGVVTSFDDITERKQAEETLRQSVENTRFIMESMPQKVFTATAGGEVDYFNAQWMDYTGLTYEEIKDWGWMQFVHPEDVEETVRLWLHAIESGDPFQIEHRFRRADGEYRWHLSRASALRNAAGEIVMWTGSNTDIHDRILAEEALRKTEKLAVTGRLAASISHEINNPLEAVTNLIYLMKTETSIEDLQAYARQAEEELARISHVVTHTLRFHRQSTRATEERLSALLDSAVAVYQGRLKSSGTALHRDYRDPGTVLCFASELRQVFSNFIGNAYDATRLGGRIVLRTRPATDWKTGSSAIRVTIADSGHGMDKQTLKRLFEPFFTTKDIHGTGLGLWISADILKKHHATVRVRSRQTKSATPASTGKEVNSEAKDDNESGTVFSLVFPTFLSFP